MTRLFALLLVLSAALIDSTAQPVTFAIRATDGPTEVGRLSGDGEFAPLLEGLGYHGLGWDANRGALLVTGVEDVETETGERPMVNLLRISADGSTVDTLFSGGEFYELLLQYQDWGFLTCGGLPAIAHDPATDTIYIGGAGYCDQVMLILQGDGTGLAVSQSIPPAQALHFDPVSRHLFGAFLIPTDYFGMALPNGQYLLELDSDGSLVKVLAGPDYISAADFDYEEGLAFWRQSSSIWSTRFDQPAPSVVRNDVGNGPWLDRSRDHVYYHTQTEDPVVMRSNYDGSEPTAVFHGDGILDMLFVDQTTTATRTRVEPVQAYLGTNYPNPFRGATSIAYVASAPSEIVVYDLLGRVVRRLSVVGSGTVTVSGLVPGAYLYRLGGETRTMTVY